jgi:hypothetical protein
MPIVEGEIENIYTRLFLALFLVVTALRKLLRGREREREK